MQNLVKMIMNWSPLSKVKHNDIATTNRPDYSFVKSDSLIELCDFEFPLAVPLFPIVFFGEGKNLNFYAMVGIEKGQNLFVDHSGHWVTQFIPTILRTYPLRMGTLSDGKNIVLVDEQSSFLVSHQDGSPLFDKNGVETQVLKKYTRLLEQMSKSSILSRSALSVIEEYELLEPFSLKIEAEATKPINISGLGRISSRKFDSLGQEKFLELRKTRALEIIYAHLFSMNNLPRLVKLWELKKKSEEGLKDLGAKIFDEEELNFKFD